MNCPECNSESTIYMHEDRIPCIDCESTIVVGYFMCTSCNYSFRTTNGKFLDGTYPVSVEEVIKDLMEDPEWNSIASEIVDGKFNDHSCAGCDGCGSDSMMDSVCNCVKCGKPLVFGPNILEYNCPHCGFEWEILEGE